MKCLNRTCRRDATWTCRACGRKACEQHCKYKEGASAYCGCTEKGRVRSTVLNDDTREAHITYRIFDRSLFRAHVLNTDDTDADCLVEAMLSGKPAVHCGYEIVRVEGGN
jgi:hypothetical protein